MHMHMYDGVLAGRAFVNVRAKKKNRVLKPANRRAAIYNAACILRSPKRGVPQPYARVPTTPSLVSNIREG